MSNVTREEQILFAKSYKKGEILVQEDVKATLDVKMCYEVRCPICLQLHGSTKSRYTLIDLIEKDIPLSRNKIDIVMICPNCLERYYRKDVIDDYVQNLNALTEDDIEIVTEDFWEESDEYLEEIKKLR